MAVGRERASPPVHYSGNLEFLSWREEKYHKVNPMEHRTHGSLAQSSSKVSDDHERAPEDVAGRGALGGVGDPAIFDHTPDIVSHPVVHIGSTRFCWPRGALVVVNHGLEQFLDPNDRGATSPDLREGLLASAELGRGRGHSRCG